MWLYLCGVERVPPKSDPSRQGGIGGVAGRGGRSHGPPRAIVHRHTASPGPAESLGVVGQCGGGGGSGGERSQGIVSPNICSASKKIEILTF